MTVDARREEQLRIQALGAALSRREWWEVEQAYNRIRDEFDRRPTDARLEAAEAAPAGEIEALKALLQRFVWKERGIMADLSTAHSNRGQGAASWMREDDRDQVEALEKLFV